MLNSTVEISLAWLVVASLAVGGLLGLWVATSHRHWFARTLVASAVLAPLLWRPVYEPFVTLLVELLVVVIGVTVYRRNWPQWRFSIAGLLMATVPVALLVVAAMRSSEPPWVQWVDAILLGLLAGALVLFSAWCVVGRSSLRTKLVVGLFMAPVSVIAWGWGNYVDDGLSQFDSISWPSLSDVLWPVAWALLQVLVLCGLVALCVVIARPAERNNSPLQGSVGLVLSVILVAAYPAYVLWHLSTPVPVPETPPVASPAIESLQHLAADPAFQPIYALDTGNSIDWKAMRAAVEKAQPEYDQLRALIDEPLTIPVDYSDADPVDPDWRSPMRRVARLLLYASTAARKAGEADEVLTTCTALLTLAHQLEGQGLVVDGSTVCSYESLALEEIYHARHLFSDDQQRQLAEALLQHNVQRPSLDPMWYRERVHDENTFGWQGHLYNWMDFELVLFPTFPEAVYRWSIQGQNAATSALLSAELALQVHRSKTNTYPDTLAELVPSYLSQVPTDPCGPDGKSILYRREAGGYMLYSRGYDGDDDSGRPYSATEEYWAIDSTGDGDLTLHRCFSEDDE